MTGDRDTAARAQRLLRAMASATNRVVGGTQTQVRGDGRAADALVELLDRLGARLTVVGDDPDRLERHRLRGRRVQHGGAVPSTTSTVYLVDVDLDPADVDPADGPLTVVLSGGALAGAAPGPLPGRRVAAGGARPLALVDADVRPADAETTTSGAEAIAWARQHMPVTRALAAELGEAGLLEGRRIAINLVLEPKTGALALALAEAGAEVVVGCRAGTTRDEVVEALRRAGLAVHARADASPAQDREHALAVIDSLPDVMIDDGSSVLRLAHQRRPHVVAGMLGATEETTSGLRPLRVMEAEGALAVPVIAVNDARCKTLFDNGIGTGESCLTTILDLLDVSIAGARVVVAGYGHVGRGMARAARACGAHVVIAEVDPVAALEAAFAGYHVAPLREAAADAELLISATGVAHTVSLADLQALPDGAAVAVAGGVRDEIEVDAAVAAGDVLRLRADAVETLTSPDGRSITVLDHGQCINCTAGEGNPIEIMDLSFAVQVAALGHLLRHEGRMPTAVHELPRSVDHQVAAAALADRALRTDHASADQRRFLAGWRV